MRKFQVVCALVAVAMGGIIMSCNKNSNPAAPGPAPGPGDVVYSEGFEESPDFLGLLYVQINYATNWGLMTITDSAAHTGKQSLTSDSNCIGIKGSLGSQIEDSTAGIQFYLMAKKPEETDFIAGMGQSGSAPNGLYSFVGMGIDKSDSFTCLYQQSPYNGTSDTNTGVIKKNVVPLGYNQWYKCNIEYNFNDDIATYYLNGAIVCKLKPGGFYGMGQFFAMRDSLGKQGPKEYYLDDVTVYKK